MKKVLIISSSLRHNSNSELLAKQVFKGSNDVGNKTEFVSLKDKDIRFCKGCLACQKTYKCVIKDDVAEILNKVKEADVLVFATPIYYYGLSGQLKTLLDRLNPLYSQEYKFKDIYLLTTSAEDSEEVYEKAVNCLEGWIDCFSEAHFSGIFSAGGIDINDIKKDPDHSHYLEEAYEFGKDL